MAVKSSRVVVGTTATLLNPTGESDYYTGQSVMLQGATAFFIGGPDVTTANGFPVLAGVPLAVDLQRYNGTDEKIYGVVATGSVEVSVLQQGV